MQREKYTCHDMPDMVYLSKPNQSVTYLAGPIPITQKVRCDVISLGAEHYHAYS